MPDDSDLYTILQVQSDAEPEVIEAAYRQLMRKYHPDRAGANAERAAVLHERAKGINRAYAVLRDPSQRWTYDHSRTAHVGPPRRHPRTPSPPPTRPPSTDGPVDTRPTANAPRSGGSAANSRSRPPYHHGVWAGFVGSISSLYYFLPGPYEWERERNKDLLATWMLPPLGLAGWSLSSGRLNPLTDTTPWAGLVVWALLAMLALPLWPSLPCLALAGAPTAVLLTGLLDGWLGVAGVPLALAWVTAIVFGVVVSARQYLFAVLPTIGLCWTLANTSVGLANTSVGLAAVGSLVAASLGWLSTGTLGVLAFASLVGILIWLTVLTWQPRVIASRPGHGRPLFRRISSDRVCAVRAVPLRTDRNVRETPCATISPHQEASVVLVRDPWAFVQTDDGREGWAEWILSP